jgi:hypothetical protein
MGRLGHPHFTSRLSVNARPHKRLASAKPHHSPRKWLYAAKPSSHHIRFSFPLPVLPLREIVVVAVHEYLLPLLYYTPLFIRHTSTPAMSAIARRSFARAAAAPRSIVRAPLRTSSTLLAQHSVKSSSFSSLRHNTARTFSTTMVQASAGDAFASPAPAAQYDQEIVDMASYIHNYKIDSELAVSSH